MDRQIVYAGAIPLDTDLLLQSRATMVAIGYLAKFMLGDGQQYVDGLGCTPAPGLAVTIGNGSMTSSGMIDPQPYGSLPIDGDPLLKVGINTSPTTLTLPGAGQYVVSAEMVEMQAGSKALVYYNAVNPVQTLIGPQGDGQPQATVVQQKVALQATTAAAIPGGAIPLYNIIVPIGATAVTQSMISVAPGAPFLGVKLPGAAPLLSPGFNGAPTAPTAAPGDASALLATTQFVANACARNRAAWGAAGSHSWTCPAGVTRVLARLWGAGGSGGAAGGGNPGGGGGGGGYLEVLLNVQPGTSYTVQVGAGGGNSNTQFDALASVTGGGAGNDGSGSGAGGGGTLGTSTSVAFNIVGSVGVASGYAGFQVSNTSVGGGGGSSFGVAGAQAAFGRAIGFDGIWPGGGASGGSTGAGGRGADGLVFIEWGG